MEDYYVFSMDSIESEVFDSGVAFNVNEVAWAEKKMWASDAVCKNGKYYLYFPAKQANGIFQIGVALSDSPFGPFEPLPHSIQGSYSNYPAVFKDNNGDHYIYFGGMWDGQLQKYRNNKYDENNDEPSKNEPALGPVVAMLTNDMLQLAEDPKEIKILDEKGGVLLAGDIYRRFFEASWVHKYKDKYYFSYSTGDAHFICYAIGDSPYGPFTYQGRILNPYVGLASHHSILEVNNEWYLFYHDSSLSKEITMKATKIDYTDNGKIITIDSYGLRRLID